MIRGVQFRPEERYMNTDCEKRQLSKTVLGTAVCGCFAVLILASGCNKAAPVDLKGAEQAVRNADVKWSKAAAAHDMNGVFGYYTDDAVVLPANGEPPDFHPRPLPRAASQLAATQSGMVSS